jgi:hypothetical protein
VDDTAKKDEKRVRAVGVVERELRVSISPAFTAKTRYPEMPTVLPLDYDEFKKYLPGYVGETVKTEEAKPEEKKSKKKVE